MNPSLNGQSSAAINSPTSTTLQHPILPAKTPRRTVDSSDPVSSNGKGTFTIRPFTPVKPADTSIDLEAATDNGQTPPKRIACIECRQQKVRCDAHEQYPGSCTRCSKKKLTCLLQPDFKRTYKRRRLVEVEQEIERLRHSMEAQESEKRRIVSGSLLDLSNSSYSIPLIAEDTPATKYSDLPAPKEKLQNVETPSSVDSSNVEQFNTPPGAGSSSSAQHYRHRPGAATASGHVDLDPSVLACTEKTMDGVTLNPATIANLFKEYVAKYHPFLPVVDVLKGPEQIYKLCPSLFWTIMAIASRRYDKDGELMMQLTPILKSCLSEITISPINRLASKDDSSPIFNVASAYTVQAFLIYTMWPSITSTLSADSSWSTAGIAMYSGIRVGLHCPGYARDFGRIKTDNPIYPKLSEQIRTWICCNIVSQTVATVYGFPAFTSFDASVIAACDADSAIDVPDTIKQLMLIQHLEEEVAKTLNSNPKDPLGLSELSERLSLIQILSRKMDELEMRLGNLDDCRKFVMLGARVHLLTYYFLDNGGYSEIQLQKGMVHVYNSALALLEHAERAYQRDRSFFRYMPGIYAQILWQSSCIICKVYHSPFSQFVDSTAGHQMYMSCVSLISKASILKHDMMYRAAEIMQQVWRLFGALARRNSGKAASPRILIRTRMSASVFFDVLWTTREEIGIRSVAPVVLDQRNPADADDDDDEVDAGIHSTEGTPKSMSVSLGSGLSTITGGEATEGPHMYRVADESSDIPTDAESRVRATLTTLPYDPKPKFCSINTSTKQQKSIRGGGARGGTRGRGGRGRGRGKGRATKLEANKEEQVGQMAGLSGRTIMAATPALTSTSTTSTAMSTPATTATAMSIGDPLTMGGDMGDILGVNSPTFTGNGQQQQQHQDIQLESVVNGVDFLSWEANNIWRDVDMLMSDFGFREDEAPSLDFLYGGINGGITGSGGGTGENTTGTSGAATPKETKRY